jgi:hypothetical protein
MYVFEADVVRLSDPIHPRLLGPGWTGSRRRGVPFYDIASADVRKHVICSHTFWGKYLSECAADERLEECRFSRIVLRKINFFLEGKANPLWSSEFRDAVYGVEYTPRDGRSRAVRLLQVLMTIDGIFQQRYLAFPNEAWNWKKFDRFIVVALNVMLDDEFLDGELKADCLQFESSYGRLKSLRQAFKQAAGRETVQQLLEELDISSAEDPLYLMLRPAWQEYERMENGQDALRVQSILSQTRGAGTPPPLVLLQTKEKFLRVVSEAPDPLTTSEKVLIAGTMDKILHTIPDDAFTGLRTKAGIRASTSACYEKTRQDGGTAQAVQDIVYEGSLGRFCYIRDLETGRVTETKSLGDCTPGEYIFWVCLEEVLAMDPEALAKVYALVVNEPGKGRTVTKGAACLKIVLDVINGICSWPLQKGVPSSRSGMGKESHGWNLFKSFFSKPASELVFKEKEILREYIDEKSWYMTTTYHDVWGLSTDFQTATDYMHHQVARIVGKKWMTKCGIPPLLQGIVIATCYSERTVEFAATGPISKWGDPTDKENIRKIRLKRGVLMGDPLTKPVLHLINISVRELSTGVMEKSWLSTFCGNASEISEVFSRASGPEFLPAVVRSSA